MFKKYSGKYNTEKQPFSAAVHATATIVTQDHTHAADYSRLDAELFQLAYSLLS